MLKASITAAVLALGSVALFAQDADLAKYQGWMKDAAGATMAARQAVTANDDAAVKANAAKAADAFDHIAKFWAEKKKDDAQKFGETARDAAKALGDATKPEEKTAALQSMNGTCRGCHTVYRNGSEFKGL